MGWPVVDTPLVSLDDEHLLTLLCTDTLLKRVPIVALTDLSDDEAMLRLIEAGMNAWPCHLSPPPPLFWSVHNCLLCARVFLQARPTLCANHWCSRRCLIAWHMFRWAGRVLAGTGLWATSW